MRKSHIIQNLKSQSLPTRCIFFDTETYDLPIRLNLIPSRMKCYTAVFYERKTMPNPDIEIWSEGRSQVKLYNFVVSHVYDHSNLYVFSANVWFDLRHTSLMQRLLKDHWKITKYFDRGHSLLIKFKLDHKAITFVNIQGIIPYSVKRMGEILGLPKLEVNFEIVSMKNLLIYCHRDTEIIFKMYLSWIRFLKDNKLGSFRPTIASQAFTAYTHRFMDHKIYIHDRPSVLRLERDAYMGGRTDAHFIGSLSDTNIYVLDINSMYPYVMYANEYPYKLVAYKEIARPVDIYKRSKKYAIVADCTMNTPVPAYAKRINNKLMFPIGHFKTCLCTGSFKYAYEHNHIEVVNRVSIYRKVDLFKRWVETLYATRKTYKANNNYIYEQMIKLILNSLYGKFGQRGDKIISESNTSDIDFSSESIYDLDKETWTLITHIGNLERVTEILTEEGFNSFPAISAHVTDYARIYLWSMIEQAGRKNVYYMDTDSLFVNKTGLDRLQSYVDNTKLGKLKVESESTGITIHGPKDYELDGKICIKGIPSNAKPLGNNIFEYIMFPSIRSDIHGGMTEDYCKRIVKKHLNRIYDKGTVTPSGFVQPLCLSEF